MNESNRKKEAKIILSNGKEYFFEEKKDEADNTFLILPAKSEIKIYSPGGNPFATCSYDESLPSQNGFDTMYRNKRLIDQAKRGLVALTAEILDMDESKLDQKLIEAMLKYSCIKGHKAYALKALSDLLLEDLKEDEQLITSMGIMAAVAAKISNPENNCWKKSGSFAETFLTICGSKKIENAFLFLVVLALHIDHGMNLSSFTSLMAGTANLDFISSVIMSFPALSSPKHGGAAKDAYYLFQTLFAEDESKWPSILKEIELLSGVGHAKLTEDDPRAIFLLEIYAKFNKEGTLQLIRAIRAIKQELFRRKGKDFSLNFDAVTNGLWRSAFDLNVEAALFYFGLGRLPGWFLARNAGKKQKFVRTTSFYSGGVLPRPANCNLYDVEKKILAS